MSFLITQMWICLALAFLLGGLLAWLLLARPLASRLAETESMWAKKNKVLGADRDKLRGRVDSLMSEMQPLKDSTAKLTTDLELARGNLEAASKAEQTLRVELDALRKERDGLKGDVERLDAGVMQHATDLDIVRATLRDAEKERDDAVTELDTRKASFAELTTRVDTDRALVEQLRGDLAAASEEHESLRTELADARKQLAVANEETDGLRANASQLERDKAALGGDLDDARESAEQLRQELTGARHRVPQLEQQLIDRDKALAAAQDAAETAKTEAASAEEAATRLRGEVTEQQDKIGTLQTELASKADEVDALRGGLGERDQRIEQLLRDLNASRAAGATADQLRAEQDKLKASFAGDLDARESQIAKLDKDLAACRKKRAELEEALAAATAKPDMPAYGLSAPMGRADDLKRVKGIGPKLEGILHGLGIYHFRQIANFTLDDVAWVSQHLAEFKGRIERDDWIVQATRLHREDYNEAP